MVVVLVVPAGAQGRVVDVELGGPGARGVGRAGDDISNSLRAFLAQAAGGPVSVVERDVTVPSLMLVVWRCAVTGTDVLVCCSRGADGNYAVTNLDVACIPGRYSGKYDAKFVEAVAAQRGRLREV